ncbi:isoaspartyl peptidase/L-asparaginase [Nannocystaceae bacterium ST9]
MSEVVVVVHGGAGTVADELHAGALAGIREAAERGRDVAIARADALDACVDAAIAAVRVLEDDASFNAGRGACMTAAGEFEVDAGIMRSRDLESGAVASVRDLADACELARAVMEQSRHVLLVGEGARAFGEARGVGLWGRDRVWTAKAQQSWDDARSGKRSADNRADTVGAVVRDRRGDLCALGSTGGVLLKLPGRVGDTPIVGAGFYAHPELGAAVATGVGEVILQRVLIYELLRRVGAGAGLQTSAQALCDELHEQTGSAVGLVAIGPTGETAVAHASEHMAWAITREGAAVQAGLR